jgi:DNA-binding NtrC family response regulator
LRQRPLDVDLLTRHFVNEFNRRGPRVVAGLSPEAMRALLDHSWPGNIRELRNVVEYAFAVGRGPVIELGELPPELRDPRRDAAARPRRPSLSRSPATPTACSPRSRRPTVTSRRPPPASA